MNLHALVVVLSLIGPALAHSAPLDPPSLHARALARRSFESCATIVHRNLRERAAVNTLRRRSFVGPTNVNRQLATGTATADPFDGAVPTCVLAPESDLGPYWLPKGYIRDDIREDQKGVDLLLDVQIFNAKTCETMPGVVIDFWSCNSTGVYSGFRQEDSLGETWLRGAVQSDTNGIAQVTTIFPGHYVGRAVHIHIMAHISGTTQEDGSYVGGSIPHVGQLYFDMSLIREVGKEGPYNLNAGDLVLNDGDSLFASTSDDVEGYDGLVTVEKLGNSLSDGLLGYISIGIDPAHEFDTELPEYEVAADGSGGIAASSTATDGTVPTTTQAPPDATGTSSANVVAKAGAVVAGGIAMVAAVAFLR